MPTPDQVRAQLERILGSAGFAASERLRRFLRYVVERSLAGEAGQLKEYVIGRDVFDRDEDYDPRLDSIVRVEAGRLRTKIDEYYHGPGRADDVIIRLQRGSYAPVVEGRDGRDAADDPAPVMNIPSTVRQPARWRLGFLLLAGTLVVAAVVVWRAGIWATPARATPEATVAVLAFKSYSTDAADEQLAARVTDGVTGELARLGTLGVVSHTTALQYAGTRTSLREIAQSLDADFIVEGTLVRGSGDLRVQVRLVDGAKDRKLWVEDFESPSAEIAQLQRRIASAVATAAAAAR